MITTTISIEHFHGRLRYSVGNAAAQGGGAFISTLSSHQAFFMYKRWHEEALCRQSALNQQLAAEEDSELIVQLQDSARSTQAACFSDVLPEHG